MSGISAVITGMRRRTLRSLSIGVAALLVAAFLLAVEPPSRVEALTGGDFSPGLIISDSLFYDSAAMTEADIQSFLVAKGSGLAGMSFSVSSRSRLVSESTGNLRCDAFEGGLLSASMIIYRAQAACGVSAKVILVTLQKEQGLITKAVPTQGALDRAMGFACPDTAPCASTTLGFGNQVYSGALQLNTYRASNFGRQPGRQLIPWHPNSACGSSYVNVQNYATAALYNYTPYQPNQAALANLGGLGDGCSSYGNRNFWVFYNTWFGSTMGSSPYTVVNPTISGSVMIGTTLTVLPGTWRNSPTLSFTWVRCDARPDVYVIGIPSGCVAIPGATAATYTSTNPDDVGKYIAIMVTGSNSSGEMTVGALLDARIGSPINTVPPTVSGPPAVGSILNLDVGTWVGVPTPTIAIYWLRCDDKVNVAYSLVPAGCAVISGERGTSYVPTSDDIGKFVTAQVAGNSSSGFSIVGTLSMLPVGFPVNTVPAELSGSPLVGSTWTVNVGTWAGVPEPTIAIYWLRCDSPVATTYTTVPVGCTVINGERGTRYISGVADVGKYVTAQVAGNSSRGFTIVGTINTVATISALPANVVPPTVSGSPTADSTWTVNPGSWTGAPVPTIAIFWLRCDRPITSIYTTVPAGCVPISGANQTTYVSAVADSGKYLTAQVAGNSPLGFALAGAMNSVAVEVQAPTNVVPPTVSGQATAGSTWTVDTGSWAGVPAPTIVIYWLRCDRPMSAAFTTVPLGCVPISGANGRTYTSTIADIGKYLTAQVAGNSPLGFALSGAVNTTPIRGELPANVVVPSVSGSPAVGSIWTVDVGSWTGIPAPTIVVFWLRCDDPVTSTYTTVPTGCIPIEGANATTYVSTTGDVGKFLTAQVAGNSPLGFALAGAVNSTATRMN